MNNADGKITELKKGRGINRNLWKIAPSREAFFCYFVNEHNLNLKLYAHSFLILCKQDKKRPPISPYCSLSNNKL